MYYMTFMHGSMCNRAQHHVHVMLDSDMDIYTKDRSYSTVPTTTHTCLCHTMCIHTHMRRIRNQPERYQHPSARLRFMSRSGGTTLLPIRARDGRIECDARSFHPPSLVHTRVLASELWCVVCGVSMPPAPAPPLRRKTEQRVPRADRRRRRCSLKEVVQPPCGRRGDRCA